MNGLRIGALSVAVMFMLIAGAAGQQGNPPGNGNPGPRKEVKFDENESPLQKAIENARTEKIKKMAEKDPTKKCAEAMENCDAATDEADIEQFCNKDVPKFCKAPKIKKEKVNCKNCGDVMKNGKMVGKKIRTETILEYGKASHKIEAKEGVCDVVAETCTAPASEVGNSCSEDGDCDGRWDRVMLGKSKLGAIGNGAFNQNRRGTGGGQGAGNGRARNAVTFPEAAVNEDKDCIDYVTGERKGGADRRRWAAASRRHRRFVLRDLHQARRDRRSAAQADPG